MKQFVAAKALILHAGKALILRESDACREGTNPHRFDLPGGRLAPGEKMEEGLRREVREEAGLDIHIEKILTAGEWFPVINGEPCHVVGIFFLCTTVADPDVVLSDEHSGYLWIDPATYQNYPLIENLKHVFKVIDRD